MRRNTRQRKAILNYLRNTRSHPTADAIYDEVRRIIPDISMGTVYRNLKVLHEMGLIRELNLNGEISRYEFACAGHYHFRCNICGQVIDIDEPMHEELNHNVALKTGLQITTHYLEFRGLCRTCQNKSKQNQGGYHGTNRNR